MGTLKIRGALGAVVVLSALLALLTFVIRAPEGATAEAQRWQAETGGSRFVVHVYKKGMLSALAHDHHFVPAQWNATGTFNPNDPRVVNIVVQVDASSLVDDQPDLSEEDRRKVEKQVRELLEASKYPHIRFTANLVELVKRDAKEDYYAGTLEGQLQLHGHTRQVRIPVSARWATNELRINGNAVFKQSDFGIEPYSTALGTIAVKDAVKVEFALRATPAAK